MRRRHIILFVTGFLLGSIFDSFHTISKTTAYSHPFILKSAWWGPFVFGFATLMIGCLLPMIDRLLNRELKELPLSKVLYGFLCLGIIYFLSGFAISEFKNLFVSCGLLITWLIFDKTWQGIVEGFFVALVGSLAKILFINAGLFRYASPHIWGIPLWLPTLYFTASVAIGNLGRYFKYSVISQ